MLLRFKFIVSLFAFSRTLFVYVRLEVLRDRDRAHLTLAAVQMQRFIGSARSNVLPDRKCTLKALSDFLVSQVLFVFRLYILSV